VEECGKELRIGQGSDANIQERKCDLEIVWNF
jgi:hypothetical protein